MSKVSFQQVSVLKVFPNPADTDINESNVPEDTFIEIYNSVGQLVKTVHHLETDSANSVDISDLDAGIYFIKLIEENNLNVIGTVKFVKK